MANKILLQSSLFHGIILLCIIFIIYQNEIIQKQNSYDLPWVIIVGLMFIIITSCCNHGSTNNIAKWFDRTITSIMTILLLFLLITRKIPNREIIGLGLFVAILLWISSYNYSKKWRNILHLSSHIIATMSVIAFLVYNRG
jgi:hypothetical protein